MKKNLKACSLIAAGCLLVLIAGCSLETAGDVGVQADNNASSFTRGQLVDIRYKYRTMASPIIPEFWYDWTYEGQFAGSSNNPLDALFVETLVPTMNDKNKTVYYEAWEGTGDYFKVKNGGQLGYVMPDYFGDSEPGYTDYALQKFRAYIENKPKHWNITYTIYNFYGQSKTGANGEVVAFDMINNDPRSKCIYRINIILTC